MYTALISAEAFDIGKGTTEMFNKNKMAQLLTGYKFNQN
jgi:hypothetical protein